MHDLLDNIVWESLTGHHQKLAIGRDGVRRYAPGLTPIAGFVDKANPNLDILAEFCEPGEFVYSSGWHLPVKAPWVLEREGLMTRMVWSGSVPEIPLGAHVRLQPEHAQMAFDLTSLTHPGPFGIRTLEMGDYFGIFDEGRLVAMAGERVHAGPYREISGVCTHPDYQGKGLAAQLMMLLIKRQLLRNETPYLNVMSDNVGARRLYSRLGFVDHAELLLRVVALS